MDGVNASVILTDAEHHDAARAAAGDRPVLVVDAIGPADDPGIETTPDSLAYVFFTSGSTGRPKGVYDTHRNVLHNVLRYTNTLEIAPNDRLSLVQSPSFSGTVSSLFSALLNGAAVFPFGLDEGGFGRLADLVRDERITIYHSVPAVFRALLRSDAKSFPDVRVVRLEGDRASSFDVELHRRHFGNGSVLVNGLGLTETGLVRQLFVDHQRNDRARPSASRLPGFGHGGSDPRRGRERGASRKPRRDCGAQPASGARLLERTGAHRREIRGDGPDPYVPHR